MARLFKTGITAEGDVATSGVLKSTNSSANEGGQIELTAPSSGSTISTNVTIDVFQNKLRFFEAGGANRGYYVDITSGASAVGTSLTGGSTGAMNYAQTIGTKQSAVSSAGTTIVSTAITTNGYPVQVTVTGDVENNSAGGWVVLQLYRGSTAIGNPVHAESSAGSENVPYSLNVIDTPAAGTYTYALKINNSAGGTFNFGESNGPVITAVELSGPKGDTGNITSHITINAQTSSYTLVLADDGQLVEMNSSSANTVTIPTNAAVAFPIGTQLTILQTGTGQTSLAVSSGVTLNCTPQSGTNAAKLRAQWSSINLIKRGTDTWVAVGDLTA